MKVLDEDPVPPRRINPRIHRDVETVCLKAMAKEKSERYRTAREFAEDIRRFRAGEAISAAPAGAFHRAGRFLSRHRTAATVSIVLLVALGPTVAYFLRRYRHEQEASRIAEAAKMSDRLASASGKVDEARRLHAEGVPDWRSRAQALFEKAMDDVRAVLARQPDQPEAAALMRRIDDARREVLVEDLLDLAHGFLDANQNVAAEKLFRWLIDYDPDNAAAREGMRLALGVGRLSLRTSPPGVEAALAPWDSPPLAAGEPIGRTPLNGAAVGIGRHRLVLSSPGTGRHELPLEVARSAAMDLGTVNLPRMADAGDGMVLVPAGEVTLFDGRRARVEAFAVDRYESGARLGEVPRRGMSWVEAAGACRAKGKRLCSFLEWRRACAGEASLVFPYGNRFDPGRCWTGGADATSAGPAGGRAGCVSPWGVYDMSGNVSEWTGKQASDAAVYGGDWSQIEGALLGCGSDSYPPLDRKAERAGFRCCVDSTAP